MELKTSWVDVRAVTDPSRYALMDATVQTYSTANPNIWKPSGRTQKGQIPTGGTDDSLRGSLKLANATMETFFQYPDSADFQPHNCFGCHNSKDASNGLNVSHIFKGLKPQP